MAIELLGVSVAPRHHCGTFSDAQVGLSQPHPVLLRQAVEPLDRGVQQFGSVAKAMALRCTVVSTVTRAEPRA